MVRPFVLLALLLGSLPADEAVPRFALDDLQGTAADHPHLRITFRQIKDLELFDRPVVTDGVLEISRPLRSVRWEFSGRSVLVLRDGRLQRWNAEGERETVRAGPASQALVGQMQALLSGDWRSLDELFRITLDPGGAPAVSLVPRKEELKRYLSAIEVVFHDDLTAPRELTIFAPGGDQTRYEFDRPQRPDGLAATRFAGP